MGTATPDVRAGLWSAPATLGSADVATSADVALQAGGTAVVAWTDGGGAVHASLRRADRPFDRPATLAGDGGGTPAVALDGAGGAIVVWSRNGELGMAEQRAAGQGFSAVSTGVSGLSSAPDVAFVARGRAIVVWDGLDGAIHALSHQLGAGFTPLPDLSSGTGNAFPRITAAGEHAVAAWTTTETAPNQLRTRIHASVQPPGESFGPPEELASAVVIDENPPLLLRSGEQLGPVKVTVSDAGAADVLIPGVVFQGMPGDTALEAVVVSRPAGGWTAPQRLTRVDAPAQGAALQTDVSTGRPGDALFVEGERPLGSTTMMFLTRGRGAGAAPFGDPARLDSGELGEVRAAALARGRFLVLLRSGSGVRSRAGNPSSGFETPLTFSGTDSQRLLDVEGSVDGLAVAAWVTTGEQLHAAIYDDVSSPTSLPPAAARDLTAPFLSRLTVSPQRFAVRRSARAAAARGTRIRWRLSEPARLALRVDRVRLGFRRGGRCVARPPRSGRVRRCTRLVRVGSITRIAPRGTTSMPFNGFMRGRPLRSGRYRVTAIPTDAAGNRGKPKRAGFTVVRR
jgi:hypothetical protein